MEKKAGSFIIPRETVLPAILFAGVNALFLAKYAARFTEAYWGCAAVYFLFVLICLWLLPGTLEKIPHPSLLFAGSLLLFSLLLLVAMKRVDPYSLIVDRFSAITAFDHRLLHGQYPYDGRTHLGRQISGFPGFFIVLIPFYLLGDVGYFQVFTFILLGFLLFKLELPYHKKTILLLLFGASPMFLWESVARSDLSGNMMLLLLYLYWLEKNKGNCGFIFIVAAGVFSGVLLSTRGIILIPLLIYLNHFLRGLRFSRVIIFFSALIFTDASFFLPFYFWDKTAFLSNNPFKVQSGYIPPVLLGFVLLVAGFLGFRVKGWNRFLPASGYVLFLLISVVMGLNIREDGFDKMILKSGFDLSYFLFSVPFLLLSLYPSSYSTSFGSGVSKDSGTTGALRS